MIWVVRYKMPGESEPRAKWFRSPFDRADFCAALEKDGVKYSEKQFTSDLLERFLNEFAGEVVLSGFLGDKK